MPGYGQAQHLEAIPGIGDVGGGLVGRHGGGNQGHPVHAAGRMDGERRVNVTGVDGVECAAEKTDASHGSRWSPVSTASYADTVSRVMARLSRCTTSS